MRTCSTLSKSGFISIETVECLLKSYKPVDVEYLKLTPKAHSNGTVALEGVNGSDEPQAKIPKVKTLLKRKKSTRLKAIFL